MKALKALVSEKSSKMLESEIPSLCSCGALKDNVATVMRKGDAEDADFQMCANNCQYYNNVKGYERALRDILHCITFFK